MPKLIVLLPAYNEEKAVGTTVREVRQHVPDARVVVIDNRSSDKTAEVARGAGAEVLPVELPGKGNAVRSVLPWLENYDYLVMMDSDCTYPADHIPSIVERLEEGYDVVMGYRYQCEDKAIPSVNLVGNRLLSLEASILYRQKVIDVCTGMWGFRREAIQRFNLTSPRFTLEVDLFINAVRTKCRFAQIPIRYRCRMNGDKSKLKIKDGLEIGWFLLRNRTTN
jgi:glycosyltransferase involved in cell wall biosynthesis